MKNKFFIFNLIMICSFSLFVVLNLFTSNGEFSQLENRVLQEAPEFSIKKIVDRTYMDETENYSNDQLLFREFFVKAKAFIEKLLGKKENNGVYFAEDGYLIEKAQKIDKSLISGNIQAVKELANTGRYNVSICVIPQAFEVLREKLPKGVYNDNVSSVMETLEKEFKDTQVKYIDATTVLEENKNEYIFYRTDHHQTAKGSYLVYNTILEAYGNTPLKEDDFVIENVSDEFLGTTYSKGFAGTDADIIQLYKTDINQNATVEFVGENKKSESMFFPSHLQTKDKYSYFLDGNHPVTVISGGVTGGNSLAVFKDSYAHSIAPMLINNFESIHLIDTRYFMGNPIDYLNENKITEVLFLYGSSTFMSDETIKNIGEYAKTTPVLNYGLVPESEKVDDSYFSDAVFLGDSLTMGFQYYSGIADTTYLCRTSMSVGGVFNVEEDGTSLVQKVKAANPGKIYVMLGINEFIDMSNKQNIMDKFSVLIDALKQDNPQSYIYIQSILPFSRENSGTDNVKNNTIYDFNETLKLMAEEKNVFYIDVYKAIADAEGYLPEHLTNDGTHLLEEGCKLWAEYLRKHAVKKDSDSADTKTTAVEFTRGKFNLADIAQEIKKAVTFEVGIEETNSKTLLKTHNIDYESVVNAYGLVGGGATAEEICLIEVKNKKAAKEIEKILREYINIRIKNFESYIPKEVPKLQNAVVFSEDTFVGLVIANDTSEVKKLLEKIINN